MGLGLVIITVLVLRSCFSGSDAPRYELANIDRGDIAQTVSANGQLSPVTLVSVGTQVSGIVTSYTADFNDKVSAGQVLMRLDDSLLQAQITQSRANQASAQSGLTLAEANWRRIGPLANEGFASTQEVDQARQALAEAKARVAQTGAQVQRDRVNLSYAVIRSPVSGVVVSRAVDVGQTVTASFQTPELYKIAQDLRQMNIDAYFTESDIGGIRVNQTAKFRVDAYPNKRFSGEVAQVRLNPLTEQNVVTYAVIIRVDNADGLLLPGMTAYVTIDTQERKNVLRVPTAALRFRPPEDAQLAPGVEPVGSAVSTRKKPSDKTSTRQKGSVWQQTAEGLKPITVTLGITDRRFTEVLMATPAERVLKVNDQVIVEQILSSEEAAKKGMKFRMND
jgi:HlyD family secretion protein